MPRCPSKKDTTPIAVKVGQRLGAQEPTIKPVSAIRYSLLDHGSLEATRARRGMDVIEHRGCLEQVLGEADWY